MADSRRYSVTHQLNIQQILHEAQNRWLRPVEICEILHNYKKFRIAPEPPNRPPSGSLFLFDRKVLRYFRKDNHNWRKKKDGKTVKEAHEKLKDGSIDVLHCYYAHGEENETFQRRTYWLLEVEYTHIVLVHYLEVKGGKQSYTRLKETEARASSPLGSNSNNSMGTSPSRPSSHYPDADSPNSANTSEYEDKISDNCLRPSTSTSSSNCTSIGTGTGHHSFPEMRHYDAGPLIPPNSVYTYDQCYNGVMNQLTPNSEYYTPSPQDISRVFDDGFGLTINSSKTQSELATWDEVLEQSFSNPEDSYTASFDQTDNNTGADISSILQIEDSDIGCLVRSSNKTIVEDTNNKKTYSSPLMKELSGDLKKHDSFSRWMSKELGGAIEELSAKSSSDSYWSNIAVENDAVVGESGISITNSENLDTGILSPSLSQDQLFSIIDFSPSWAYVGSETKVLMTGTFLKQKEEVDKCNWSCMFGEEEVPAQILSDGTLRCYAPVHKVGRVPFYVSCSNRIACSEIREFEFRESSPEKSDMEISDPCSVNSINEMHLKIRLEKLLSLDHHSEQTVPKTNVSVDLYNRITALLVDDDEWSGLMRMTDGKDWLVQKLMKDRLNSWLIQKVSEEGKGPNVLGQEGQGVIHLAAALGYDWAIKPIVIAGVNVNFRDVHGWTALHWAASCGRERTVVALKTLGADPGTLTDPTPEFPSGRTPADLASMNGHKGIAGFLAESSLTSHLSTLTLKDLNANITTTNTSNQRAGFNVFEDTTSSQNGSMEDSLSAVRNATQAAARIYQVFRLQSFHRKKILESGQEKNEINEEEDALALLTVRSANKSGSHEAPLHSAAARIQNKFRGWKGRKEFLIIRQRIVKIQAHVRGHQARKRYRIQLTVGIVKVIIRWRRKSAALRGAKNLTITETAAPSCSSQNENENKKEDNYDVLQEGRKQTEARLQRALARVKSMVQYPEARDQYRRLMNGVSEHQENKAEERIMSESEDVDGDDFMAGLEEFGGDDIMFGLEELAR